MGNLSLYKAAEELAPLLDDIDLETGEMSPELEHALQQFEGKSRSVIAYILNQDATADAIDEAAAKLAKRAEKLRARSDRLRNYLAHHMKVTGTTSIVALDGTFEAKFYLERDASVDVFDENQIPVSYLKYPAPPKPSPDKTAIKKALAAGKDVPGARIVKKDRLEIKS